MLIFDNDVADVLAKLFFITTKIRIYIFSKRMNFICQCCMSFITFV